MITEDEFSEEELDEAIDLLETTDFDRDSQRSYQSQLEELRGFIGMTAGVELGFLHDGVLFSYQVTAEWYDNFLSIVDMIDATTGEDDDAPLGGYFSNN